ncbi:MAG: hypothetical protein AAF550_14600 [Myxococcota bacterium]
MQPSLAKIVTSFDKSKATHLVAYEARAPLSRASLDEPLAPSSDSNSREIAELMKRVRVTEIYKSGATQFIIVHGAGNREDRRYEWGYAYQLQPGGRECADAAKDDACGRCSIELGERWSIYYRWLPTDPVEIEKRCKLGDASFY